MKRTNTRLFALLLAAVMVVSMLPASARGLRDDEAVPAIPLGEEIAASPASVETPVYDDSDAQAELMAGENGPTAPTIPGYNQVTNLRQIKSERKYLIVAQATNGDLYALYLNANGADKGPGATGHPECTATLTVSGATVSAVSTANTSTSIAMSDLDVTIAESTGGKYTIKNSTHALALNTAMYAATSSATNFALSFVGPNGDRFSVYNNSPARYLTFNVNGDSNAHYPNLTTGFCGYLDAQPSYLPVYLFINGDLPVEPGMNLAQMLSGDKIGGGGTPNQNSSGTTESWTLTADENPDGQNSWVFTGGRAAQGSFADVKGARTYAGHFEEYIRYTQTKTLQSGNESTSPYFQRHVINAAYEGQTLQNIVDSFEDRITPLKPRAISYLVDEGGSSEANFAANLSRLITKALALQNITGMLVVETLTAADKTAVDEVVNALPDTQKGNVLSVQFTLTAAQKTGGYPNANGHFAMAQQLADAVAGRTVSTATNWPYGAISASVMDTNFPNKTSLNHAHGYTNPTTLSEGQQAIKGKVEDEETPMTWLFMGDSITHGAAWTGGYDTLAQLFEKFVKDDLNRTQDVVINAGSSGATTASTISDLNRRLVKYSPDVVVVMLGTNDAGGSVSETTYKTNIRTILDKIIAKGATPVLRTPPPTSRNYDIASYAGYIRDVVEESKYAGKVILVDQYGLWMNNDWSGVFSRDTLHPDEAGHLWFAHQLIKEMALWNDSYKICRLEYVEMKEPGAIEIPGYTQLTDIANLDEDKGYLIVSRSADGELYALYPSAEGETLKAGDLTAPGDVNDGARAAHLHVSGDTVTANWLKGGSDGDVLKMSNLLFTIKRSGDNYVFTAFKGRHLNMADYMFTEGSVALTVTSRGTAAPNAFTIRNVSANRVLDFTKRGDPNAFAGNYGIDFWCPRSSNMAIYLFASDTAAIPTAKDGINDLMTEIAKLNGETYTRASWAALQTAKTVAQAALDSGEADGDATVYVTARDALRDAFERLNEKPVIPTVPAGANVITDWKTMVPANGTSTNEPFAYGTGGSNRFRIPAIITLQHQTGANASKNGRLLSAIDARWNHTGDACCLDTIVSYSDDTGANWKYTFPNYFGDSTDAKATDATAFIDPVLLEAQDGTIYLMVDIWPGGIALNTAPRRPATASGYVDIDGTKRLALYTAAPNASVAAYDYYVGDFDNGYAPVYAPMGDEDDIFVGYYIDEYYYLYYTSATDFANKTPANDKIYCQRLGANNTWVQQNVFFYNATLHVRDASYLWIVTSTDGGETWGDPVVINDQVRTGEHSFYGVGPGCGLCVETNDEDGAIPNGTLMLPVYVNPNEQAGFIYSTDGGDTWIRSSSYAAPSSVAATSESCLVQIDATTVRHFYRESWKRSSTPVAYTDHTWNGSGWVTTDMLTVDGVNHYGACQVSAIKYSKQVDGKDLILYSTPINGGGRSQGVIYAFLVNNDAGHTMELYNTYAVNGDLAYAYSSLTETADGDIALLYESNSDAVIFKIIPITDLIPEISVTGYTGNYNGTARTVTVTTNPNTATLQYSVNDGAWSATKPTFTNAGTYTVKVKATWGSVVQEATATVTINQVTPTLTISSDLGTALEAGENPVFTISGVPGEGAVTLTCPEHGGITLTKQSDGTYTGSHGVVQGQHTFTASYTDPNGNYADATATYRVTVAPAEFGLNAQNYTGTYDGQAHSITVTAAEGVTLTYCDREDGEYTATKPAYTNAGAYTTYFKAVKGTEEVTGSANVNIAKATTTLAILCGHEDHGETHSISTADLPLVLTITGVPNQDQGHFTLTTFNDAVRNLTRNEDGTWTATPNMPRITRTYHFIATFDPTQDQDGNEIENPNYEPATDEFTVTISRPADEVIDFNFSFVDEVKIDSEVTTRGTFEALYDGLAHGPLPAVTYDSDLELTYHVAEEDAEIGSESWTSEEPTFKQPGTYTVSIMASPATSPVAKVLTVVLKIVEEDIPTTITITPDVEEFEGGGTLKLTVEGAPQGGTIEVTSRPSLTIRETARGQFEVTLPNTTQTYIFSAEFGGAGSYQPSHATCTVSVTAKATHTSKPSTSATTTKTETTEDGTKVTTETKPDGTKVQTVEEPDGTKSVTETKKDGTVTATVEEPDGTKAVTETKPDGSKTATVEQPDGTTSETVTTKDGDVTITVTDPDGEELVKTEIPATIPEPETKFVDIDHISWAVDAINNMAALNLVNGVGGDKYSPTASMTRGQIATVLHRLSNGKTDYKVAFKDVENDKYYAEGVAWAAKANVVKGVSQDRFAPDQIITREQMATMLCRYAKLIGMDTTAKAESLNAFVDGGKTGSWAVDSVAWCVENGILTGKSANNLDPNADVTRAEVAVMLDRFLALIK